MITVFCLRRQAGSRKFRLFCCHDGGGAAAFVMRSRAASCRCWLLPSGYPRCACRSAPTPSYGMHPLPVSVISASCIFDTSGQIDAYW